jgi:HAD superfamily hydrolase (TIGR01459 family)
MPDNPDPQAEIPALASLAEVAERFDVILCDVWGVLHNGVVAFAPASEALTRFRAGGGAVVLISNAPRPNHAVLRMLDKLGVPRTAFDAIVTSGDLSRAAIADRPGQTVYHLGPQRDHSLFEGLDVRFGGIAEADYVVCSGFFDDDRETVEDHQEALERMRARDLLMICANPDLVVERGDRLIPCAGAIAEAYEAIGGRVVQTGKPHRPIYEAALEQAAQLRDGAHAPHARVLAIGDAIRTDIAGAHALGIPALFVTRGIHAADLTPPDGTTDEARVRDWLAAQAVQPQAFTDRLAWR